LGPENNRKKCLDGLLCPRWRKTTQSRSTITVYFFAQIVDSIPELLRTARPDGYLDFVNQTWLDFTGVPPEKLLGWGWTCRIHPDDLEAFVQKMRESFGKGKPFEETSRVRRADGVYRWMLHRRVPRFDGDGKLIKWHGSSIDIDDRKRAEEQLIKSTQELKRSAAYLAEAQRLSHTGSFGWNPDTGEIVWSDETYRIFEYDCGMKPTLNMLMARLHPQDRALFQQVIDRASQAATDFEHEYRLLLADGRVKHVHAIAHVLEDGSGNRKFIGAVTDITERYSAFLGQGKRDDISNARLQSDDSTTEKARAMKTECLRVIEPNTAPANIATTAAIRRCKRGLVPRARDESAAMPVMVNVSTVVVMSGTAS
jgi:PAS domain S-box-containing protein